MPGSPGSASSLNGGLGSRPGPAVGGLLIGGTQTVPLPAGVTSGPNGANGNVGGAGVPITLAPGVVVTASPVSSGLNSGSGANVVNGGGSGANIPGFAPGPIQQAPNGAGVVIGSQTIPANQAFTTNGATLSAAGSTALVVNGPQGSQTIAVPTAGPPGSFANNGGIGGGAGGIAVGSTILALGQIATISGTTFSAQSSALVINGASTLAVPTAGVAASPITLRGQTLTPSQVPGSSTGGGIVIGGTALTPGQTIVTQGTTLSAQGTSALVVNNGASTIAVPNAGASASPITLGGQTVTPSQVSEISNGGGIVVDGTTLTPGQTIVTRGTTLSAQGTSALIINNGASTISIPSSATSGPGGAASAASPIVLGGQTLTPSLAPSPTGAGGIALGSAGLSTTLTPGQQITTAGQVVSAQGGTALVINGSKTVTIPGATGTGVPVGSQTITPSAAAGGSIAFGATTLTPGQVITTGGQTVSAMGSGAVVVNGMMTIGVASVSATATATATATVTASSRFSGSARGSATASASATRYTGAAAPLKVRESLGGGCVGVAVGAVFVGMVLL